jgi:hypothetical protein
MAQEKNREYELTAEGNIIFTLEHGVEYNGETHTEVEMREILGVDEEAIAKPEVKNNIGRLISTLLSGTTLRIGTLTPKSFKKPSEWFNLIHKLPLGDRDTMMLMLRIVTKGNAELKIETKCPNDDCKCDIEHMVDLDTDIEYKPLEVDPDGFSVELPKPHKDEKNETMVKEAFLRLPNGDDQETLDTIGRKNAGQANTQLLVRCLKKFGDMTINPALARSMSTTNREFLIRQLSEKQFGPKMVLDIECPSCGTEIKHGVHPVNFL